MSPITPTPLSYLPGSPGSAFPKDFNLKRTALRALRAWRSWPGALRGGAVLALLLVIVSAMARVWTPYSPFATGVGSPFQAPSLAHLFGTDQVGSDLFSKTLYAGYTDIWITVVGVVAAFVIGSTVGAVAGLFGGLVDVLTMRLTEIVQSFPALLLAMLLVSAVGGGIGNVLIVVVVLGIPGYLRLARAEVRAKRELEFVDASRLMGNGRGGLLFKHLLPNSIWPLVSFSAVNASWVAIIVASLGFIGVGIQPGSPEWGSMISAGANDINQWWVTFFPGLFILLLSMSFHLLGDGLADAHART
jgi:peptide/nickel transport system permease protein